MSRSDDSATSAARIRKAQLDAGRILAGANVAVTSSTEDMRPIDATTDGPLTQMLQAKTAMRTIARAMLVALSWLGSRSGVVNGGHRDL